MMNECNPPEYPGLILNLRFLDPLGIRPSELAKSIGVSGRRVSELLKGRRRLSPETAHRLALYFGVPARWFLEMQAHFDAQSTGALDSLRARVGKWDPKPGLLITPRGAINLGEPGGREVEPLLIKVSDEMLGRVPRPHCQIERLIELQR